MQVRYDTRLSPLAAAVASVAATTAVAVGLFALLDSAGRSPWLRDTPEARTAVARCAARDERGAQQRCVRQLVAAAQARDAGRTQLAQAAAPPR
jgi:hypothetical protein